MPHVVITLLATLALSGCMDATVLEYESLTYPLDDKNELHISTYPAGFPKETFTIPFLYKAMRSPDEVYFQVFVRERGKTFGRNPHVESILIEAFSYSFPGEAPVQLLSHYPDNFWMQGNEPDKTSPIPHAEGWQLQLRIDLTLNGSRHVVEDTVEATSSRSITPLILYSL